MKRRFLNLLCIGCLTLGFAACSDDDKSGEVDPGQTIERGEDDAVLSIKINQASPRSYAAGNNRETATPEETEITGDVKVFIYDGEGILEKTVDLGVTDNGAVAKGRSWIGDDEIEITAGRKFIYVFANTGNAIQTPGSMSLRKPFEQKTLAVTQTVTNNAANLTVDNNFYMGSLEPTEVTVPTYESAGVYDVTVEIGRFSAKVFVDESQNLKKGDGVKGNFVNGKFRIINEPKNMYYVAQTSNGFNVQGSQITTPYFDTYLTANYYTPFLDNWEGLGNHLYTSENTNKVPMDVSGTSVEIVYKYEPAPAEIYSAADPTQKGTLSGDTFWVGEYTDGSRVIFDADPSAVADVVGAKEYKDGLVYYIVPIADVSETEASKKYAVLRNHYYELTINNISRLGGNEPGDPGDPDNPEPIDQTAIIDIEIVVLDWYKIEQPVDL